jgi:hypothetical protein
METCEMAGEGGRWKGIVGMERDGTAAVQPGRMEERLGDGNERVRGSCSVKERGE